MKKYNQKSNMVGGLIKRKREEMCMSASDVCKKLKAIDVLMNKNELYRIEKGQKILKDFEMVALFRVLNINFDEIEEGICMKNKLTYHHLYFENLNR